MMEAVPVPVPDDYPAEERTEEEVLERSDCAAAGVVVAADDDDVAAVVEIAVEILLNCFYSNYSVAAIAFDGMMVVMMTIEEAEAEIFDENLDDFLHHVDDVDDTEEAEDHDCYCCSVCHQSLPPVPVPVAVVVAVVSFLPHRQYRLHFCLFDWLPLQHSIVALDPFYY